MSECFRPFGSCWRLRQSSKQEMCINNIYSTPVKSRFGILRFQCVDLNERLDASCIKRVSYTDTIGLMHGSTHVNDTKISSKKYY